MKKKESQLYKEECLKRLKEAYDKEKGLTEAWNTFNNFQPWIKTCTSCCHQSSNSCELKERDLTTLTAKALDEVDFSKLKESDGEEVEWEGDNALEFSAVYHHCVCDRWELRKNLVYWPRPESK